MKHYRSISTLSVVFSLVFTATLNGCAVFSKKVELSDSNPASQPLPLSSSQVQITLLGINDFHGYIEDRKSVV